jgi:hypothetical protein
MKLAPGTHAVHLGNPDFQIEKTISVTIRSNETVRKKIEFPH